MATEYSIQKMVSDGTLSTIALGIQYLQRNDIYIRIAGEETPQSGAPSGYTWSFLDNTTLKILPVVPNGVEVVVYRRTDVDAMYNVYSHGAQFDESTIDENNTQLLYITQEYLEQGATVGVDTIEFLRDDGYYSYYRIKRTDGSYTDEFAVPSAGNSTKVLTRESLRRSYAEAGYNLVDGSFEAGATANNATDVVLFEAEGKAYSWGGAMPKVVPPASSPATTGGISPSGDWLDIGDASLRTDLSSDAGSAMVGTSIGGTVEAELALARTNRNQDGTVKASRVLDVNGLDVEDDYQQITKHRLMQAPLTSQGGVILLGDSIGLSQGATNYKFGYLYRFMRSLLNRAAGVGAKDQGFGYESYLNMSLGAALDGITHTGTIVTGAGAADSRLRLLAGQSITITGRQALTYDIFYDPALSSGNIEFYLNGVLYDTKTVSAAISTFSTSPFGSGSSIHPDDVVQIKAATGTVIVTGITTLREASSAPYVTAVCRSGWGFDEFSVQARVDEVAAQVRFFKSGGPFTVFVMLGTNNIFHPVLRKTPTDYITALNTLIGKYVAALNGLVNIVLQVPLPANESTYPILPGYSYADYVKAIVEYGSANGYPVIRFDRIGASNAYYADGIHPNNAGHAAMAAKMCDQVGVPFAYGEFHQTPTIDHYREGEITYNAKYKDYLDLASVRVKAHKQGRIIIMSGIAEPNGATGADLIIGTLPKGMRPVDGDIYTVASANSGPVSIVIKRDGTVNVKAVPTGWISFTGVSFVIRSQS